jgi:hypothetical protein
VKALDGAFARVDRAGEHLANLKGRVDAYVKPLGGGVEVRVVPGQTPQFPPDLPDLPELPLLCGILIGETAQNLRTALDYLVYELANWRSDPDPNRRTQFPIETTPKGFDGRVNTYLEGVLEEHVAAIKGLQPFNSRNWLWRIREISNTDKHNVVPATIAFGEKHIYAGPDATTATLAGGYAKPGDPVGMYFKIPMSIALREAEDPAAPRRLPPHLPAIELLEDLIAQTRGLLETFEPVFEAEPPPRVLIHRRPQPRKRKKRRR